MSNFNWEDYFSLAEKLSNQKTLKKACLRSAASRAYYSLYNIALDYACNTLKGNKKFIQYAWPDNPHIKLARHYRGLNNTNFKDIGHTLSVAREVRKDCDYFDSSIDEPKIKNCLEEIKKALSYFP